MTSYKNRPFGLIAFAFFLTAGLLASGSAVAQGPVIGDILISIQDTKTKEIREEIREKDTIHVTVGDRVRLRFVAEPNNRHASRHYPVGTYELHNGAGMVSMTVNDERGSAVLTAHRSESRNKPGAKPFIRFQITDKDMRINNDLRAGTIYVVVNEKRNAVVAPAPEPDRVREDRGITLYEHQDFRGISQKFTGDDRQLNNDFLRQDMASSVRLDPGCQVILYEHPDFEGKATVLTEPETDLRRTRVGSDTVSSLKVECGGNNASRRDRNEPLRDGRNYGNGYDERDRGARRGATLFEHQDFHGRSETFFEDSRRLNGSVIQHDSASSIRVDPGCRAVLYEHPDFGGRASVVTQDETDLGRTRVGNDSVSSLEVRCEDRRR